MLPIVASECIQINGHSAAMSLAISLGAGSRKRGISSQRSSASHSATSAATRMNGLARSRRARPPEPATATVGSAAAFGAVGKVMGGFARTAAVRSDQAAYMSRRRINPSSRCVRDELELAGGRNCSREASAQRRGAPVAGRLVEHAVASRRIGKRCRIDSLAGLQRIEPGAQHEQKLIAQHLAGGAQLPGEAVALAQQPRLAERATILEAREYQRDQCKVLQVRREL